MSEWVQERVGVRVWLYCITKYSSASKFSFSTTCRLRIILCARHLQYSTPERAGFLFLFGKWKSSVSESRKEWELECDCITKYNSASKFSFSTTCGLRIILRAHHLQYSTPERAGFLFFISTMPWLFWVCFWIFSSCPWNG